MTVKQKLISLRNLLRFDNWLELLFQRTFFRKTQLITCRFKGMEFMVDYGGHDECGIYPCLLEQEYRRFLTDLDAGYNLTVLDVGANAGGFLLMLRAEGFQIKKAVAIELNPNTCARLLFNLQKNIRPTPIVINAAVTGSGNPVSIPDVKGGTSNNIFEKSGEQSIKIQGVIIDNIIADYFEDQEIDLCKVDIEGAEYDIVTMNSCYRLKQCKNIIIEIHKIEDKNQDIVINMLTSLGFKLINKEHSDNVFFFKRREFTANTKAAIPGNL